MEKEGPKHEHDAHFAWDLAAYATRVSSACGSIGERRRPAWTMARRRIVEGVWGGGRWTDGAEERTHDVVRWRGRAS